MITGLSPVAVFDRALGHGSADLVLAAGESMPLPVPGWLATAVAGADELLARCHGATVDIGCGPGRLTAALHRRGLRVLGIDVSPRAVALTRSRGAPARCADVFTVAALPRWHHVLLADGNVGIGGDPVRLLWRCRDLLEPDGTVLIDVEPPGSGLRIALVRLRAGDHESAPFRWAWVGVDALADLAAAAGLRVVDTWLTTDDRWQAELAIDTRWPCPVDVPTPTPATTSIAPPPTTGAGR